MNEIRNEIFTCNCLMAAGVFYITNRKWMLVKIVELVAVMIQFILSFCVLCKIICWQHWSAAHVACQDAHVACQAAHIACQAANIAVAHCIFLTSVNSTFTVHWLCNISGISAINFFLST